MKYQMNNNLTSQIMTDNKTPSSSFSFADAAMILGLLGFGVAGLYINNYFKNNQPKPILHQPNKSKSILIGDVGGTNVRYRLISQYTKEYTQANLILQKKLKVSQFDKFEDTIDAVLNQTQQVPDIIVIAIAGPVNYNTIRMSQVDKWGLLSGENLRERFKCKKFVFINDFEASAYALLDLKKDDIVMIKGEQPVDNKPKLIIGPGTGLGTAILVNQINSQPFVIPGEGGHRHFAPSNPLHQQYHDFYVKQNPAVIDISQALFCGPSFPTLHKFLSIKYPQCQYNSTMTSQQIIAEGVENENSLCRKVIEFFIEMYGNSTGDEILMKLPYGGVYLQGSITSSVLPLLVNEEIGFMKEYIERRKFLKPVFDKIPIVFVKQIELGLRGAYVYVGKLINSQK